MEKCAECKKPITIGQPGYYKRNNFSGIGEAYHWECGDSFGQKAKDKYIAELEADNAELKEALAPYAVASGYGLDGQQPNRAWIVLKRQKT